MDELVSDEDVEPVIVIPQHAHGVRGRDIE